MKRYNPFPVLLLLAYVVGFGSWMYAASTRLLQSALHAPAFTEPWIYDKSGAVVGVVSAFRKRSLYFYDQHAAVIDRTIAALRSRQVPGITLRLVFSSGVWVYPHQLAPTNVEATAILPFALVQEDQYKLPWEIPAILKRHR